MSNLRQDARYNIDLGINTIPAYCALECPEQSVGAQPSRRSTGGSTNHIALERVSTISNNPFEPMKTQL
jgi:hypothetical protein